MGMDQSQGGAAKIAPPLESLAVDISSLVPDPSNARKHSARNVDAIAASLARFGQRKPIVVQRKGMVVRAGNGTLAAAKSLGWTRIAAVVVDEEGVDATAYAIADNRTAELAEWDDETLASLLQSLPADAREVAGFNEGDLAEVLDRLRPEVVEDEAPAPLADPVSRAGDVWLLGSHRLLCGDCTKPDDVAVCLHGARPFLCMTDPPYGCGEAYVSHVDTQESLGSLAARFFPIARDACVVVAFTPGIQNIRHYPHADWMLCWFYGVGTGRTPWGFTCWQPMCVWGKDPKLARGQGCHPDGVNKLMSSDDAAQNREIEHACPKPVSVWCWFLDRLSERGDTVYEPFSGSGTTIVACEQLGRKCYAIEIEPRYVDVGVRRWEKLTGKSATLESSGKTWADTAKERGVSVRD